MEKLAIERSIWIAAPRERVWQAVIDPMQIAQWFAPGTSFSQNGNTISVRINEVDVEVAVIELLDPPRQITTRNLPDRTLTTTYTLEEENGGTRFTVTETGFESLSEESRQARLDQDNQGWEMALENLKAFIDGRNLPRPEGF
ncbi:MAG TPA: SRPBCC domain-containing protein [Ktedonobacteraceae bacterium]|nr:SRPBCC domain-containing protein [Ktedonobacteraceae bacterium]